MKRLCVKTETILSFYLDIGSISFWKILTGVWTSCIRKTTIISRDLEWLPHGNAFWCVKCRSYIAKCEGKFSRVKLSHHEVSNWSLPGSAREAAPYCLSAQPIHSHTIQNVYTQEGMQRGWVCYWRCWCTPATFNPNHSEIGPVFLRRLEESFAFGQRLTIRTVWPRDKVLFTNS